MSLTVSVVIPALNEEALIGQTLQSVLTAMTHLPSQISTEIIVVDNGSTDGTRHAIQASSIPVRIIDCHRRGSAAARNVGAHHSFGDLLIFLDADTTIPALALKQIVERYQLQGASAGITRLAARHPGFRASCWWVFWNSVRCLPLPYAKAMPAFMFCTRAIFDQFGPFNEGVAIGEEWPILAGVYRARPHEFVYLRSITARTSSRRMELVRFGYLRLFVKYVWAILDVRGRIHYSHTIRQNAAAIQELK